MVLMKAISRVYPWCHPGRAAVLASTAAMPAGEMSWVGSGAKG